MNYTEEQIKNNIDLYNKMRETLLNEQKNANGLNVIDGTTELINGESIKNVTNLPL